MGVRRVMHSSRFDIIPVLVAEKRKGGIMPESVYKIIEIVGSSPKSWEEAAKHAVDTASESLKDLRVAEVTKLDLKIEDGKIVAYRARVNVSFKYLGKE
jgi:flavin-binding protein dodecin